MLSAKSDFCFLQSSSQPSPHEQTHSWNSIFVIFMRWMLLHEEFNRWWSRACSCTSYRWARRTSFRNLWLRWCCKLVPSKWCSMRWSRASLQPNVKCFQIENINFKPWFDYYLQQLAVPCYFFQHYWLNIWWCLESFWHFIFILPWHILGF